ncbi:MAG: hypothetical protein JSS65_07905 [Armatimonadetes bacterium]|nr:hypothetical protein [Armatimonadota bacterium]
MDVFEAVVESWDRQARIIDSLAELVTDKNRKVTPGEERLELDMQLCHIHGCRKGWLKQSSPQHLQGLGMAMVQVSEDDWQPNPDLNIIREQVKLSAKAVRDAFTDAVAAGKETLEPYDHPVLFLQHMLWHEGWHAGQIILALRNAGEEPTEEWEEKHIWELWRGVEVWP